MGGVLMPAGLPPRRPYRAVGVSPETAFVLTQLRRMMPELDSIVTTLARDLEVEGRLRVRDDLEELERHSGDFARWRAFDRRFDVEPATPTASNMSGASSHDEVTTREAAAMLGLSSTQHIGRLVSNGQLKGRKVHDRALMVTRASVEALRARRAG